MEGLLADPEARPMRPAYTKSPGLGFRIRCHDLQNRIVRGGRNVWVSVGRRGTLVAASESLIRKESRYSLRIRRRGGRVALVAAPWLQPRDSSSAAAQPGLC